MAKAGIAFAALSAMYMGAALPAQAESFPACSDDAGNTVAYVTDEEYVQKAKGHQHIIMTASARFMNAVATQEPAIGYDPDFIDKISPMARAFTFFHECHHLSSGDARLSYFAFHWGFLEYLDRTRIEYEADCSAVKRLRDELQATVEDIEELKNLMKLTSAGRVEKRFEDVMGCYLEP